MGQCLSTLFARKGPDVGKRRESYLPSVTDLGILREDPVYVEDGGQQASGRGERGQLNASEMNRPTRRPVPPAPPKPKELFVRGMYDFQALNEDDLPFKKGDRMVVDVSTLQLDWWLVTHVKTGKQGYIPSNYVCPDDNSPQAQDWWFSSNRNEADLILLLPGNSNGTYLVRESGDHKSYVLSVRQENQVTGDPVVRHYRIRRIDQGGVYISPRQQFPDLFALIDYYSTTDSGLCTRLTTPCPRLRPLQLGFQDLEMDRAHLQFQSVLGNGYFGEVWKAKLNKTVEVAVKTLKPGTMSPEQFLNEARIMHKLRHRKLVNLLGVCSQEEPIFIVTEYMAHGALLDFLRKDGARYLVRFPVIIKMAAQIADGMAYLEEKKFVHRDLRAANILVGEHYEVKVADFGLARILDHDNAYNASETAKFPIKWTAPEAGLKRKFTVKSDVWSFGILLYELVTYGRVPYPGIYGDILVKVNKGYRMPNPAGEDIVCPDPVYDVMMTCWRHEPSQRPTFEYLKNFFTDYEVSSEEHYAEQ